ncbi:MAG: Molybdopterin molybdenumtransferase [Luteibacter sp.]|uniref:molybdopterin molybdotransferase MoeA n=1 Tax=Luteibacter sp. TaxID=1886636 RepID=UPI00137FECE8|nr:molybdopterin molybdotransferase MoeA [Luteibacter sp.]KAF1003597.1 MAG: Molybdopterin molybdenumtransferase [Luteibacter sp.]
MISYRDAIDLLLAETARLDIENVSLDDARGRVLARAVTSPLSLPGFDNSVMDGFALRTPPEGLKAGDTFEVVAMHAAGDATASYPGAEACEIATGARIPDGFDSVVPVERCERIGMRVRLSSDEAQGQNIRRAGSDVAQGDEIFPSGRRIDAASIMLLAALGIARCDVTRQPRVAIINTGSELHDAGVLPDGGIHDSNGPYLAAALSHWGVSMIARSRVPDTGDAFHRAVAQAREAGADLIVTTGAVSAGRFDFVPEALVSLGARELFHKVAIRPGKLLLAARFDDGPLVIALPGNPIAVAVGYRFFVAPVLRAMAGMPREQPRQVPLVEAPALRMGLRHFQFGTWAEGAPRGCCRSRRRIASPRSPGQIFG